jgi:hypothetical protein
MSRVESPDGQLIELLRRSDMPSDEDVRRIRDAVAVRIAVGVGASTALVAATHSSWGLRLAALGTWAKGAVLATTLVGVGIGVAWQMRPTPAKSNDARQPAVAAMSQRGVTERNQSPSEIDLGRVGAPVNPAGSEPQVGEQGQVLPEQKGRTLASKAVGRSAPSTLEAELEIIGRAQRALTSGQPNEALRALDEHAKRFPSGVLSLERTGVRTVALCQSGRVDEGRAAARSYLRSVPNSVLSKRIRVACQLPDE